MSVTSAKNEKQLLIKMYQSIGDKLATLQAQGVFDMFEYFALHGLMVNEVINLNNGKEPVWAPEIERLDGTSVLDNYSK